MRSDLGAERATAGMLQMRLVIGIGGKSAPSPALSVAVCDERPVVGLRELAPAGLAATSGDASPIEVADAWERFEASGEGAVAVLGERRSWAIVEGLMKVEGASGLFIFDDAANYIARRISTGGDLATAAADWINASSRLLRAAEACREAARLVNSADIAAAPKEFSYYCETHFGVPVETRSSAPPSPLELVIASYYVSTHDEVRSLAEELAARSDVFGQCEVSVGGTEAALAHLLSLYEKGAEIDALRKDCAILTEQLRLAQHKAETRYQASHGKGGSANAVELAKLSAELEHKRHEIAALKQSTSWKVSAPLRFVSRVLKRLANRKGLLAERRQLAMLRRSDLFDADWYRAKYSDVAASRQDPAKHFLRFGASEGRSPSAKFNTVKYLKSNPDVAAAGVNPLIHYLQYGRNEARAAGR